MFLDGSCELLYLQEYDQHLSGEGLTDLKKLQGSFAKRFFKKGSVPTYGELNILSQFLDKNASLHGYKTSYSTDRPVKFIDNNSKNPIGAAFGGRSLTLPTKWISRSRVVFNGKLEDIVKNFNELCAPEISPALAQISGNLELIKQLEREIKNKFPPLNSHARGILIDSIISLSNGAIPRMKNLRGEKYNALSDLMSGFSINSKISNYVKDKVRDASKGKYVIKEYVSDKELLKDSSRYINFDRWKGSRIRGPSSYFLLLDMQGTRNTPYVFRPYETPFREMKFND